MNKTSPSDTISGYNGVDPKVINSGTWQQAIQSIKSDKYKPAIEAIRAIKAAEGEDAYRKAKTKLRAVTFGGTFNGRRHHTTVKVPTGILVPDLDHLPDVQRAFTELIADEHVWFAFISPGGDGIKCGLRSETVTCDAEHKQFFYAVEKYFKDVYGTIIDPACKDISRLSFMSWDPDAYINEAAEYFDHSDFESFDPPPDPPPHSGKTTPAKKKYGVKVLESAYLKISNSQPGDQHFTRIKQATTVGGFIPTGYITYDQAITALEQAVAASGAENMVASNKDIADGLAYGATIPLDPIGEQDAEREAIQNEPAADTDEKPVFEFIHNADILANLKPIEWQIKDVMVENSFYYDFGDPGSFKSFAAIDRMLHIAAGIDYHGHPVKQGTVFYVAGEGQQGIGRRIAAWHIEHKTKAADVPFFVSKMPTQLIDPGAVDEVRRAVDALTKEYGPPAVLHIDTLARNFGDGDENATKDMNLVIHNMDIAFGNDFCRGITHHTGHTNKERARGSIALHGAADSAFRFVLTESQQIYVECKKMKDAASAPAMLFNLNLVNLIIGDSFDHSFTLELAAEGDEAIITDSTSDVKMSQAMKRALSLLDEMYAECENNLACNGREGATPRVEIGGWRDACVNENIYKSKSNFNRALESMKERKKVYFDENNHFVYSVSIYLKYLDKDDFSS